MVDQGLNGGSQGTGLKYRVNNCCKATAYGFLMLNDGLSGLG